MRSPSSRAAWLSGLLASSALAQNAANASCDAGIRLFVARGTEEPEGTGSMGIVAASISAMIGNSTVVPLKYPATFESYFDSVGTGVQALWGSIAQYANACPDGRMALLGYSQGAQVAADTVCGSSGENSPNQTKPLSSSLGKNVVAIIMFGDPTHVANISWTVGTSKKDGIFPRENTSSCDPYADRMRSWCDTGDRYCDLGNQPAVHHSYAAKYTTDAAKFVVSKFNETEESSSAGGGGTGTGSPGAAPTSTASGVPLVTSAAGGRMAAGGMASLTLAAILWGLS